MNTLDLHQAAALLKMHPQTVLQRARVGEIPGAKPGKCWVFVEEDLINWLRSQYGEPRHVSQGREKPLWHFTEGKTRSTGGSALPTPTDEKYDAALGRPTKGGPRNTKTA